MKNKGNAKYYALIAVFTLIFFLCMAFCFMRVRSVARDHKYKSLAYRREAMASDEKMFGASHIFSTLYFDKDHEEAFDAHWDFCDAYLAYVRGRFSEEKTPYIEALETYLDTAPGGAREKTVKGYLEELRNQL